MGVLLAVPPDCLPVRGASDAHGEVLAASVCICSAKCGCLCSAALPGCRALLAALPAAIGFLAECLPFLLTLLMLCGGRHLGPALLLALQAEGLLARRAF